MPDQAPLSSILDWQRGVDQANQLGQRQPSAAADPAIPLLLLAMGQAGDTLKKNAPLLAETAPGRMADGLMRFATGGAPYAGPGLRREDYTDDPEARQPIEPMIHDAANVTDIMSMGGMPLAKPGALGMFGGRMAVTADHRALARAETLAKAGAAPDHILRETGWFQGPDSKWRFEIPDNAAKMTGQPAGPLSSVMDHPELYAAYPHLADLPVKRVSGDGGYYQPGDWALGREKIGMGETSDPMGTLLHEGQHAIQRAEGFESGTSPTRELDKLTTSSWWNPIGQLREAKANSSKALDNYFNAYGEREARNVSDRRSMTPQERIDRPPSKTMARVDRFWQDRRARLENPEGRVPIPSSYWEARK